MRECVWITTTETAHRALLEGSRAASKLNTMHNLDLNLFVVFLALLLLLVCVMILFVSNGKYSALHHATQ
jgi:hypothetical protein